MNIHVIVRSAGERTAEYCCAELVRQTSESSVERVELTPFWKTLREGLERGLNSGAPWVLSVDADVIPAPDAVSRASGWIDRVGDKVGVVSGMIQDKFMGGVRFGGIRLYRATVISEMLELMPPEGETVRPESTTIVRLAEHGWTHETLPDLVGLHDYEQYFRDIYRKAFLHMQKHDYVAGRFLPLWKKLAVDDADYRAALGGAADAILELGDVDCDASHSAFKPDAVLQRLGLKEKGAFDFDQQRYDAEVLRLQEAMDSGEVASASPPEQEAFDAAIPDADVLRRIKLIGTNLKLLAALSPEAEKAALHQARRALQDKAILDTFSTGEIARYAADRVKRGLKR